MNSSLSPLSHDADMKPDENGVPLPKPRGWKTSAVIIGMLILLLAAFVVGTKYASRTIKLSGDDVFSVTSQNFESPVVVDINGQVKHPGVYKLPFNARVYEAIEKAGGVLPDADLSVINRAAWVEDGSQITIPQKSAPAPHSPALSVPLELPKSTFETSPQISSVSPDISSANNAITTAKPVKSTTPKPAKSTKELPAAPVDLNRASAEELQRLPGVGPAMAERILAYRKENQGFRTVDDLDGVRGIGEKKLEKIRPFVIVKPLPFPSKITPIPAPKASDID